MGRSATLGRRVGERYTNHQVNIAILIITIVNFPFLSNMDFPTPLSHLVVRLVLAVDHGRTTSSATWTAGTTCWTRATCRATC